MFKIVVARTAVLALGLGLLLGWASTQEPPVRRGPPDRRDVRQGREAEPFPERRAEDAPLRREGEDVEEIPRRRRGEGPPITRDADEDLVRHGEYLVRHVAMCVHCHTPRHRDGRLDEARLLHGAPMPIASPVRRQIWAFSAPRLAGLPGGWTADELAEFLQTGHTERRPPPRPPMPPYRLNERDATAVAAYLAAMPLSPVTSKLTGDKR